MKFQIDEHNGARLGLKLSVTTNNNVIIFFNEIEEAACYKADFFRLDGEFSNINSFIGTFSEEELNKGDPCSNKPIRPVSIRNEDIRLLDYNNGYYFNKFINVQDVKYIATLNTDRNNLYIKNDFLPNGSYFVVLSSEDREGNIVAKTLPYFFNVDGGENINKILDVLDSIRWRV